MGKIRRGGYIIIWWRADHSPRHVHVFDKNGQLLTRVNLATMQPMDMPKVSPKVIAILRELQREGRL
ncbi:MAG: hypothetical protein WCS70_07045 [Verrucomicrobiota bacterium]